MFSLFILLLTLFLTGSKKGIFGLILGVSTFYFLKYHGVKKRINIVFLIIALIVLFYELITSIPILYNQIGYRVVDFIDTIFGKSDGSISTINRIILLKQAIIIWGKHPIIGIGLNNFSLVQTVGGAGYYAHNNYAELLADLGIVGFFLIYYYLPIRLICRKIDDTDSLRLTLKSIVFVILIFDFAVVSYQSIQIIIFYWLYAAALSKCCVQKSSRD